MKINTSHTKKYSIMASEDLSQEEADRLISISKKHLGDEKYHFPSAGELLEISLISAD